MQSVHVEVQERSTTFRQMLVAFGVDKMAYACLRRGSCSWWKPGAALDECTES